MFLWPEIPKVYAPYLNPEGEINKHFQSLTFWQKCAVLMLDEIRDRAWLMRERWMPY